MSTYALVTKADAGAVTDALGTGRVGGFVVDDPLGTIVLFDPPTRTSASTARLAKPARHIVTRTGVPAWLLLADEIMAEAVMLDRDGDLSLQWFDAWEPSEEPARYLADRQEWDLYCAEIAQRYGEPERGADLGMVRNDPVPGAARVPLPDLLRRVCAIFGLPDVAVGRSLLEGQEPGLYDAHRVEPAPSTGVWQRLFART
jgi:hypothetical protein